MSKHIRYSTNPCNGELVFYDKGKRDDYYKCTKCGDIVKVITCPSWEDYVLRKHIMLPKEEFIMFIREYKSRNKKKVERII